MKFITILNNDGSLLWINIQEIAAIFTTTIEEDNKSEILLKNGRSFNLSCTALEVFNAISPLDNTAEFNDIR